MGRTNPTQPIPSPPPATAPVNVENTPAQAPAYDGETGRAESRADDRPAEQDDADTWVGLTEKAVANAQAVGTSAAWQNAAQAAGVLAEMAHTMRVTAQAPSCQAVGRGGHGGSAVRCQQRLKLFTNFDDCLAAIRE
jgi:hypothetical protein